MSEARQGIAPKTGAERGAKLRNERKSIGLKRREVVANDDEWPQIKALAEKLAKRRVKAVAKRAP